MHIPPHFAWHDGASILAFCRAHPFATVVSVGSDGPEAQHVPLLSEQADGRLTLHGHVAAGNPLWRASSALAVFSGPHAFVSGGWYDADDVVPTWNYLSVHAAGPLQVVDGPLQVGALFARLATATEGDDALRWQRRLSSDAYQRLAGAIRWFRIDVVRLDAKAKLSQHHPPERRRRVVDALRSAGGAQRAALADAMERTLGGAAPWPPEPSP